MGENARAAIPELAGLCSYEDAVRVGFGVEESVRRESDAAPVAGPPPIVGQSG